MEAVPAFAQLFSTELQLDQSQWEASPAPVHASEGQAHYLEADSLVSEICVLVGVY